MSRITELNVHKSWAAIHDDADTVRVCAPVPRWIKAQVEQIAADVGASQSAVIAHALHHFVMEYLDKRGYVVRDSAGGLRLDLVGFDPVIGHDRFFEQAAELLGDEADPELREEARRQQQNAKRSRFKALPKPST